MLCVCVLLLVLFLRSQTGALHGHTHTHTQNPRFERGGIAESHCFIAEVRIACHINMICDGRICTVYGMWMCTRCIRISRGAQANKMCVQLLWWYYKLLCDFILKWRRERERALKHHRNLHTLCAISLYATTKKTLHHAVMMLLMLSELSNRLSFVWQATVCPSQWNIYILYIWWLFWLNN